MPGYSYNKTMPKRKRKNAYQTNKIRSLIQQEVKKAEWSKRQVTVIDFDETTGGQSKYALTVDLVDQLLANDGRIFSRGSQYEDDNGSIRTDLHIRIDAIKWQFRFALGENETTSAVSQTIRFLIWRTDQEFQDITNPANIRDIVSDQDGSVRYTFCYGNSLGVYADHIMYLKSQAADTDTTVGGQRIMKGYKNIKYTDTYGHLGGTYTIGNVQSEKGQLVLSVVADDPDGVNAQMFGFMEIIWRYLE